MARRKGRRTRGTSPHPGVVLRRRTWASGAESWFARWTDPISQKTQDTNLTALHLTSEPARRAWAITKAEQLAEEHQALAAGRFSRDAPSGITEAVTDYLKTSCSGLRPRTVHSYRESLRIFEAWCEEFGVDDLHALTPPLLLRFRSWLIARPRQRQRSGGEQHEWEATNDRRSSTITNRDMRQIKTFLTTARRQGVAPRIDAESLKENLIAIRGEQTRPEFLRPADVRKLLQAALRHDDLRFDMTRDEKARGEAGETPCHPAIAPLVLTALLTGARINELLTLPWAAVHLDGRGEMVVAASVAKTKRERAVDLGVCPTVATLLRRMQLAAGATKYVFGGEAPLTRDSAEKARRRLRSRHGAPSFTWQNLRQSCATYSMCAPALFGTAGAFVSARRLGHSVTVAESRYAGLLPDLPRDATTLEDAMGIKDLAEKIALEGRMPAAAAAG